MNFQRQELLKPIQKIMPITTARVIMPILSHVLITFLEHEIQFYATSLDISVVVSLPHENETFQQVCVHGKSFLDLLRALDNGEVKVVVEDNVLKVSQGKAKFKLPLADPEEFPAVPTFEGTTKLSFKAEDLRRYLDTVDCAVSIDETRLILNGVLLAVDVNGNIEFVATDGFRMSMVTSNDPDPTLTDVSCVIPKSGVFFVKELLDGETSIEVGKKSLRVKSGDSTVDLRLLEGNFPSYKNAIPDNKNIVTVKREDFNRALRQAQAVKGEGLINLSVSENRLSMASITEQAEASIEIEAQYAGNDLSYQFRTKHLLDAINPLTEDDMTLTFPDAYGAIVTKEGSYTAVVMPMRG